MLENNDNPDVLLKKFAFSKLVSFCMSLEIIKLDFQIIRKTPCPLIHCLSGMFVLLRW